MQAPCFPFIVGRGRSGSTLLRAMFDSHPEMAIPHESHFVVNLGANRRRYEAPDGFRLETFLADLAGHWAFPRWELDGDLVADRLRRSRPGSYAEAIRGVYGAYAASHGKTRYADKTPGYVMSMRMLTALFPESRFVHLIRDGRNVALSYMAAGWGPGTLEGNAIFWKRFVRHGRRWGRRLGPARYRELRYEDLMDDPERHVRDLCGFMELDFDPAMLRYFERADSVIGNMRADRAAGHQNLRRPPTREIRDWRRELTSGQAARFEALAGDLLDELGYERSAPRLPASARISAAGSWVVEQARRAGRGAGRVRGAPTAKEGS